LPVVTSAVLFDCGTIIVRLDSGRFVRNPRGQLGQTVGHFAAGHRDRGFAIAVIAWRRR